MSPPKHRRVKEDIAEVEGLPGPAGVNGEVLLGLFAKGAGVFDLHRTIRVDLLDLKIPDH